MLKESNLLVPFSGSQKDQFKVMKGPVEFWAHNYYTDIVVRGAIIRRMVSMDPGLRDASLSAEPSARTILQRDVVAIHSFDIKRTQLMSRRADCKRLLAAATADTAATTL